MAQGQIMSLILGPDGGPNFGPQLGDPILGIQFPVVAFRQIPNPQGQGPPRARLRNESPILFFLYLLNISSTSEEAKLRPSDILNLFSS